MKKTAYILLAAGCMLIVLMAGYFLGRKSSPSPVIITKLPTQAQAQGLLNINTATSQELQTLPGIGEVLAHRIIAYRETCGPFQRLSDLTLVEGIGLDIIEKISDYATTQEVLS